MMDNMSDAPPSGNDLELSAQQHERRVQQELNEQHRILVKQAKGIFAAIKGRRGASNEEYWQQVFSQAKVDYETGKFLIERLGADRQLDLELVATLTQLRQQLILGIESPTTADHMLADSAILAYRNLLRVQGWIGSTAFVVQRELFGQEPLESTHGYGEAMVIEKRVEQLEQALMPLLDRAQRMMIRALDRLEAKRCGKPNTLVSIGTAGQVNVGSKVHNDID
ncbi:MAG: hypothetical protein WCB71_16655 [Aestuariivirga sp.]